MNRYTWRAIIGAAGLFAALLLLRRQLFPWVWLTQLLSLLLPSLCLAPALYCAGKRQAQLRLVCMRQDAERRRLLSACQIIHEKSDALSTQLRQLSGEYEQLRTQYDALLLSQNERNHQHLHQRLAAYQTEFSKPRASSE